MSTVDINGGVSIGEVEDSSDISIMQSASISGQTPANPGAPGVNGTEVRGWGDNEIR